MTDAHTAEQRPHLSPEQAAQLAEVSRWTILRAIKSQRLQARRDNRNRWQISPHDLEAWSAHTVQTQAHTVQAQVITRPAPEAAQAEELPALRAALTAEAAEPTPQNGQEIRPRQTATNGATWRRHWPSGPAQYGLGADKRPHRQLIARAPLYRHSYVAICK